MKRLSLLLDAPNDIRCPLCQDNLLPEVLSIQINICICHPCSLRLAMFHFHALLDHAHTAGTEAGWYRRRNLLVYAPDPSTPRNAAAHLLPIPP